MVIPKFTEMVGAILTVGAMAVCAAVVMRVPPTPEMAQLALGALIAVVSGGVGFFLRGKVQPATP